MGCWLQVLDIVSRLCIANCHVNVVTFVHTRGESEAGARSCIDGKSRWLKGKSSTLLTTLLNQSLQVELILSSVVHRSDFLDRLQESPGYANSFGLRQEPKERQCRVCVCLCITFLK